MADLQVTELDAVRELVAAGALFVLNDSGGKDSQAQRILVSRVVPAEQLLVMHAALGRVEWPGALEHARDGAARSGLPFLVAKARKSFRELVEHRHEKYPHAPAFPTSGNRQCTSDLKRDPLVRDARGYAVRHGRMTIVTCMGMRAAESPRRRAMPTLRKSTRYSTAGRSWWDWLPIHHLTTPEVFATIREAGETPHPAYAAGNERLSCVFCILGSRNDARNGAIHNPELFEEFVELERATGSTVHQSRESLEVFAGITVAEARAENRRLPVVQGVAREDLVR